MSLYVLGTVHAHLASDTRVLRFANVVTDSKARDGGVGGGGGGCVATKMKVEETGCFGFFCEVAGFVAKYATTHSLDTL